MSRCDKANVVVDFLGKMVDDTLLDSHASLIVRDSDVAVGLKHCSSNVFHIELDWNLSGLGSSIYGLDVRLGYGGAGFCFPQMELERRGSPLPSDFSLYRRRECFKILSENGLFTSSYCRRSK